MSNELKRLWDSTESLFERFDVTPDKDGQMRVLFEEVYEYTNAWLPKDKAEEAADVIVTLISSLMPEYVTYQDLTAAIDRVIAKNDAKQPGVTHEYKDGKIRRISK